MRAGHDGFTLVELLIAIAIVVLLLGLLFPVLRAVRLSAQRSVCASNQHQAMLAVMAYAGDNDGVCPAAELSVVGPAPYPSNYRHWWYAVVVGGYLEGVKVTGPINYDGNAVFGMTTHWPNPIACTTMPPPGGADASTQSFGVPRDIIPQIAPAGFVFIDLLTAQVPYLADTSCPARPGFTSPYWFSKHGGPTAASALILSHRGCCNVTFGDGHTLSMRPDQLTDAGVAADCIATP
jgi:prepilin-type N-terminal cleavage/methylation domain-containing protein